MLAGMALDEGIIAAKVIEGSFTTNEFMKFLCEDLVCDQYFLLYSHYAHCPSILFSFLLPCAILVAGVSLSWIMHVFIKHLRLES